MLDYISLGAAGFLFVVVIILIFRLIALEKRLKSLTQGKGASSLEEIIRDNVQMVEDIIREQERALKHRAYLERKIQKCVRKPETVRFNPFHDAGSNQSFAVALVNEEGDGLVMSSLYAQGKTSIFAKPVREFSSEHELTEEELHVLSSSKPTAK